MLIPCQRDGVWVLVEADNEDAGMPERVVALFPGPLGELRAYVSYWARIAWAAIRSARRSR